MKLWIDDLRVPPSGWVWAKTSSQAIDFLDTNSVQVVSFDHDLGIVNGQEDTTRPVALWMCEKFFTHTWEGELPEVYVHSANRVGREWLISLFERYGNGVKSW